MVAWITFILLLNGALDHLTGIGYWNFQKYPWLINEIVLGNQAQIIGMGYVVVKFLFPRHSEKKIVTAHGSDA